MKLINVLNEIKDRVWLTHQAAMEFLENRHEEILGREMTFSKIEQIINDDAIGKINKMCNRKVLFRDRELGEKVIKQLNSIVEQLKEEKSQLEDFSKKDTIIEFLEPYFSGKINPAPPPEEIEKIVKEGRQRYEDKIPPGFEDQKNKDKDGIKIYGDLFIWKQLIDYSNENKKSVIFFTDDDKEDWWLRIKGKTIGPLPELLKEFREKTKQKIYIYNTESFLKFSKKYLNAKVDQVVIDEAGKIWENQKKEKTKFFEKLLMKINTDQKLQFKLRNILETINSSDKERKKYLLNILKNNIENKTKDIQTKNPSEEKK